MEDLPTGFVFEGGKVRAIDKLKDSPTVSIYMNEDRFLDITLQEITMQKAWYRGYIRVDGENFLRDFLIFDKMFKMYPQILEILNPSVPVAEPVASEN